MINCMLVSDTGPKGSVVTFLDKFYHCGGLIQHFDIKIFSKETYEYFKTPRKLNSYALQLSTSESVPLGILCIVAVRVAEFNWWTFDYEYSTIGVPGIAMPVGVLDSGIFY